MNNLDKILQKIADDADEKCKKIDADTRARLSVIEKDMETKIAVLTQETAEVQKKEIDSILSRATAECAMLKRESVLAEKSALLDEAYFRAEKAIRTLPEKEYGTFLTGLAAAAITDRLNTIVRLREEYGETEDVETDNTFTIVLSKEDRIRYGETICTAVAQTLTSLRTVPEDLHVALSDTDAPISGGVLVRYGDMETCCSITALLASVRDQTEADVAEMLFS